MSAQLRSGAGAAAATAAASQRERLQAAVAAHQRGDLELAVRSYEELLQRDPQLFDAWRLLGGALRSGGAHAAALPCLERALALRPESAPTWRLHADSLAQLGRLSEAADSLERALRQDAADAAAWTLLGQWRFALGQFEAAGAAAQRVTQLAPDAPDAWFNLALAQDARRRPAEALACYERVLALAPGAAEAWCGQAKPLKDLGRNEESGRSLARCLELAPDHVPAWNSRASLLRDTGDLSGSLQAAQRALALAPDSTDAWAQLGCTLSGLGRPEEAQAALARAVELAPQNRLAAYNLGVVGLSCGQLPQAWEHYEQRRQAVAQLGELRLEAHPDLGAVPTWERGQTLQGRHLAVLCEQGHGDAIQFCRYLPRLIALGARVSFVVPPALARLFAPLEQQWPGVRVLAGGARLERPDLQCLLLSLPHRLATTLDEIPTDLPYLQAEPDLAEQWRARLAAAAPGARRWCVGLAWSGNPGHGNDRNRSIPLARFEALFRATGNDPRIEWHSLQSQVRPSDEAALLALGIVDHRAALDDWAQTAALLSWLDAVVCVDTGVAHLAGALGRPVILLLPDPADWRWLRARADSPWYPGMRLVRRAAGADWSEPLERAGAALAARLAAGAA
jgi:tetratricopeptide (TPR) repeat protein